MRNQIGDVKHKTEVDLRSTEERTLMLIDKYFQKLQHGTGNDNTDNGSGGNAGPARDIVASIGAGNSR